MAINSDFILYISCNKADPKQECMAQFSLRMNGTQDTSRADLSRYNRIHSLLRLARWAKEGMHVKLLRITVCDELRSTAVSLMVTWMYLVSATPWNIKYMTPFHLLGRLAAVSTAIQ